MSNKNKKMPHEYNSKAPPKQSSGVPTKKNIPNPIDDISDSEISDASDISDATVEQHAKKTYLEKEFLDKVFKYVKTDDLLREKISEQKAKMAELREEQNVLKEKKASLEEYILNSLDNMDQKIVNIAGNGKLTKNESVTKGAIKIETIKESISENLKKEGIMPDEAKQEKFLEQILNVIDIKRPKKTKVYLKRTFERKAKAKNATANTSTNKNDTNKKPLIDGAKKKNNSIKKTNTKKK